MHGDLCRIPFEILLTEPTSEDDRHSEWTFLVRGYDVAYVHSGTVFRDLRLANDQEKPRSGKGPDFVTYAYPYEADVEEEFVDGDQDSDAPTKRSYLDDDRSTREPLYYSAREVLDIARLFVSNAAEEQRIKRAEELLEEDRYSLHEDASEIESERFRVNLRKRASEAALKQDSEAMKARILHLSCHGQADLDTPRFSRLILSRSKELEEETGEDGYLFFRDLIRLKLDVELLVLAACETNAGTRSPLEGITSLSRAGLVAGARAVISTLWKVDDKDSRSLLVDFYRNWIEKGHSRIHALSEAKRQAIRNNRSMHTWAGYQLWDVEVE